MCVVNLKLDTFLRGRTHQLGHSQGPLCRVYSNERPTTTTTTTEAEGSKITLPALAFLLVPYSHRWEGIFNELLHRERQKKQQNGEEKWKEGVIDNKNTLPPTSTHTYHIRMAWKGKKVVRCTTSLMKSYLSLHTRPSRSRIRRNFLSPRGRCVASSSSSLFFWVSRGRTKKKRSSQRCAPRDK